MKKLSPVQSLQLCFLDVDVTIQSDSSACLHQLSQVYRRFCVERPLVPGGPRLECVVQIMPNQARGPHRILLDNVMWPLHHPGLLEDGYLSSILLKAVYTKMRSHFLIHAGVVACGGQGIILAADSLHGKTTLVLELVRRGFSFLSDDMAALGRTDQYVYPFPRSLLIRRGSLELAGFPNAADRGAVWLDKLLLDIDDIQSQSLGEAVPIRHLIILQDPAEAAANTPHHAARELGVLVDRVDRDLLAAIEHIEA